jgi:hypothetical protein
VLDADVASNVCKQDIQLSECNFSLSDDETNKHVKSVEGNNKQLISSTNNFGSFVFGPITKILQFSFRRIYPGASPIVTPSWNSDKMGNLQGSESKNKGGVGTGKSPAKGKKDKSGKKSPAKELQKHKPHAPPPPPPNSNSGTSQVQRKAAASEGNVPPAASRASNGGTSPPDQSAPLGGEATTTTYVVTDSWRHVKRLTIKTPAPNNTTLLTPPSRDSSSESVFTDPLTPQGFAEVHNSLTSSYHSDPRSAEQANRLAANSEYFDGADDSVFTSLNSDAGMVVSDGVSDKDRRGGSTPPSTTDLDDVTLTLLDSTEQLTDGEDFDGPSSITSVPKRPQSHSLDALDEEDNVEDSGTMTKSLDALEVTAGGGAPPHTRTTQPPSSFTLVRHRKVELNPLASGEHSQMFCTSTRL